MGIRSRLSISSAAAMPLIAPASSASISARSGRAAVDPGADPVAQSGLPPAGAQGGVTLVLDHEDVGAGA